jgi:hypothetical protein
MACGSATVTPGGSAVLPLTTTAPGESTTQHSSASPRGNEVSPVTPRGIVTTLVISSSNTRAASGASVTLQGTVESTNPITGTVTFYDGATALDGPVKPNNGVASLTTSKLSVGTHTITASYSANAGNSAIASSDKLEQTITGHFTIVLNATSGTLTKSISIPASLN